MKTLNRKPIITITIPTMPNTKRSLRTIGRLGGCVTNTAPQADRRERISERRLRERQRVVDT